LCEKAEFILLTFNVFNLRFEVLHRPDICEFSITLKNASGNEQRAFLRYLEISDGKLNLYTTVVPSEFEGQGIAKVLANAAFEYCHQNNLEVILFIVEINESILLSALYSFYRWF